MRNDAQLAGSLNAWMLPIRRADWALDPAGCRPTVYRLVADDLGLPILGQEPRPSGARRRRVVWSDHLRVALSLNAACSVTPRSSRPTTRAAASRGSPRCRTAPEDDLPHLRRPEDRRHRPRDAEPVRRAADAAADQPQRPGLVRQRPRGSRLARPVADAARVPVLADQERDAPGPGDRAPPVQQRHPYIKRARPARQPNQMAEAERAIADYRARERSAWRCPTASRLAIEGMTGKSPTRSASPSTSTSRCRSRS
jgi:hypothetical protein